MSRQGNHHYRITATTLIISALFVLISDISYVVYSAPDTTVQQCTCSQDTWSGEDNLYGQTVDMLLSGLVYNTPEYPNYTNTDFEDELGPTAYGFAQCNQQLSEADCCKCLEEARNIVKATCTYAVGAKVELVDCSMRYENFPFQGIGS